MNPDEVVGLVEHILAKYGNSFLNSLQATILRQSCCDRGYQDIANSMGYEVGYVKQVGSELWQHLSQVLGEKVTKRNVREVLGRRLRNQSSPIQSGERTMKEPGRCDWGRASAPAIFYGRDAELALLKHWILEDSCRLIGVLGMGGIGKTALSIKLAQEIQEHFDVVVWRSLRNAPPVNELLKIVLEGLQHPCPVDNSLSQDFDGLMRALFRSLRQSRCLIIIDNVETVMQPGDRTGTYQPGYEKYSQLFHSLGSAIHQSAIVLTSREKPQEIACQEGSTLPVRSLRLQGLQTHAGQSLFESKGNFTGTPADWNYLNNHYAGNPLALKVVAPVVQDLFNGQLRPFVEVLVQETSILGDIRDLLSSQIDRLSQMEQQVMAWLTIHQEPVTLSYLKLHWVTPLSLSDLIEALTSLERRSLIERDSKRLDSSESTRFSLQPVVMKYMTEWLIEHMSQAIQSFPTSNQGFFHTHTLILAQAKDYIRDIQTRLILKPVIKKLLASHSQNSLEELLRKHLDCWRSRNVRSYASGNVLDILQHLKTSLHNWDFSHLTIWQAYLQEASLQNVNFTQADLSGCVFKDAFSQVLSIAFSPDGQLLAFSDISYQIHVWRVSDAQPLFVLQGQDGWGWSVTISPDNQTLATSANEIIKLWDLKTGDCHAQLRGSSSRIFSLAFSPDGQWLASGCEDHTIRIWSVRTRKLVQCLVGHTDEVRSIAFTQYGYSKVGKGSINYKLASGSYDGTIRLWDLTTGTCTPMQANSPVCSIAFNPDGQTLASGHQNGTVEIWDVVACSHVRSLLEHTQQVRSVSFRPDTRMLATGSDDQSICLWNWKTGDLVRILKGHNSWISNVIFSPDGCTLVSSSEDQSVRLWDSQTNQLLRVLQGHNRGVWSVAMHPSGDYLVSGGQDRSVRLWPIVSQVSQSKALVGHQGWVLSVAVSPNGKWIASGGEDRSVRLWNSQTGDPLATWLDHTHEVWSVAFCPKYNLLLSGSLDRTVRIWNPATKTCEGVLQGHSSGIWALAASPDGRHIASGSQDQTVRLWDIETQRCIQCLPCEGSWVRGLAFSPDGRYLSSGGSNGFVMLWDLKLGQRTVVGTHPSLVLAVAFSPDGQWLASCGGDTTIKLWNITTQQCHQTLVGHNKWVRYVTFSPDSQRLISCSQDEKIQIWTKISTVQGSAFYHEKTLRMCRPYEGMNISGATGLTKAQKVSLKELGATDAAIETNVLTLKLSELSIQ